MENKIEDVLYQCIENSIHKILKKTIKPTYEYRDITQIKKEDIIRFKKQYGIAGIILDLDGTVKNTEHEITKEIDKWITLLKQEFKVCIVSNAPENMVKEVANKYKLDYVSFAKKPLRKSFFKASDKMGLDFENVMVIGNSIIADIYGGNRNTMRTLLVDRNR